MADPGKSPYKLMFRRLTGDVSYSRAREAICHRPQMPLEKPASAPAGMETPMTSLDSFKCARTLNVGTKTYSYYSLPVAEKNGLKGISRLPFSMKVLLENLLRNEDGPP
jgi:hypothetical protein